jgi:hypothetical protein
MCGRKGGDAVDDEDGGEEDGRRNFDSYEVRVTNDEYEIAQIGLDSGGFSRAAVAILKISYS